MDAIYSTVMAITYAILPCPNGRCPLPQIIREVPRVIQRVRPRSTYKHQIAPSPYLEKTCITPQIVEKPSRCVVQLPVRRCAPLYCCQRRPLLRIATAPIRYLHYRRPVRTFFYNHRPVRRLLRASITPLRFFRNRQPVRTFFRNRQPVRRLLFGRRCCRW